MAKVIEEEPRPGETFLGTSGVVIPRGLTPSDKKKNQKTLTRAEKLEETLKDATPQTKAMAYAIEEVWDKMSYEYKEDKKWSTL